MTGDSKEKSVGDMVHQWTMVCWLDEAWNPDNDHAYIPSTQK
jgi:hypothetical protein